MKRNVITKWCLALLCALTIANVSANGWVKDAPMYYSPTKNSLAISLDTGFYLLQLATDSVRTWCGVDSCIQSGFDIIKYDKKGNIVWKKIFFPPQDFEHFIYAGVLQHYTFGYAPKFIISCNDNSGFLVKYAIQSTAWICEFGCLPLPAVDIQCFYAKFDNNGNEIWSQKEIINDEIFKAFSQVNNTTNTDTLLQITIPEYIHTKTILSNDSVFGIEIRHKKFNYDLDLISTKTDTFFNLLNLDSLQKYQQVIAIKNIIQTTDNGYLIRLDIAYGVDSLNLLTNHYILKTNSNNIKEWIKSVEDPDIGLDVESNLMELNDKYGFAFRHNKDNNNKINFFFIDKEGNNVKATSSNISASSLHLRIVNNQLQLIASNDLQRFFYNNDILGNKWVYMIQFDENDSAIFTKKINMPSIGVPGVNQIYSLYNELIDLKNSSTVAPLFYFNIQDQQNYKYVLVNIDSLGNVYTTKISGTIFGDKNDNCTIENSDAFLRNYSLRAINQTDSFYTSTDTLGNYEMYLDTGNYQMQLLPNPSYPLWQLQNCSIPTSIQLNDGDSAKIDIGLTPTFSCTNLTVSLTAPILRRCFENTYYVNYCNNGTVNANNAYIDITLDHFLDFNASTQSFTNLGNNVFRFDVGNVETGKCGSFSFAVTVNCDSTILGQTHCTEAHIFPDTVCSPTPYTGAIIQASATCKTNKVEFKLKNIGGNMQTDRKYIVIQDQVLRMFQNYNLPSGNELIIDVPLVSGATYRIEAEQPANFPSFLGDPKVAAFIEGCRTNSTDTFATGIISQFPLYDGEPFRAVDCQQNRGSYDPNDKQTKPIGVGAQHFIDKNVPLDYTIRFQNTGTDTAFTVSIIDTISSYLDINSIVLETSSHACRMIRIDTNVIQFLFENIKLVDSTMNLNASNGFVQFHIQQKNNNTLGTVINNTASIYFDYNPAIFTNIVFHTIGENYLRIDLISATKNEAYKNVELSIFPNPFHDKTSLLIKNVVLKNPRLILLDATGKMVDEIYSTTKNEITIYRNQLNAGMYFYQLFDDKIEVATGKIIVQ